ncbi:MAG: glycosyltransferase family 4 protein [SAR202 cluster bacterium]|nr:glycosyltransferase family 4 protein [SAR202 cluster bacterium]
MNELASELAGLGYHTHLFFVGDPMKPGHEDRKDGRLHLHRWCQWISRYHPNGVYDGEDAKRADWDRSLAPWAAAEVIGPLVRDGKHVVVLAEEWHTAVSAIELSKLVRANGWQSSVQVFWNANNTFGLDRIPLAELQRQTTVTTVSRWMRLVLAQLGLTARVIPNGISGSWLAPIDDGLRAALAAALAGRTAIAKVARFDPDKNWLPAIDAVAEMKRAGMRPLLIARGGMEGYAHAVMQRAERAGLRVRRAAWVGDGARSMIAGLASALDADVAIADVHLNQQQRQLLFNGVTAVLANSSKEPFGLVGLETMAAGGVAMVGATGEDYATHGYDSISIQSNDPSEIVTNVRRLVDSPGWARWLRDNAHHMARRYTWNSVCQRALLPMVDQDAVTWQPVHYLPDPTSLDDSIAAGVPA